MDADEEELLDSVERGEWKSSGGKKRERTRYARYAKGRNRRRHFAQGRRRRRGHSD